MKANPKFDPTLEELANNVLGKWAKPALYYYNVEQVCTWLTDVVKIPKGFENAFRHNNISGRKLPLLVASDLPKMGIHYFDVIKQILKAIRDVFKIDLEQAREHQNLTRPERKALTCYFQKVANTGEKYDNLTPDVFLRQTGLVPVLKYQIGVSLLDSTTKLCLGRMNTKAIQPGRFLLNKEYKVKIVIEKEVPEISIFRRSTW